MRFEFQGSGILAGGSLLKTTLSFQWLPVLRRRTGSFTTSTKVLVEERRLKFKTTLSFESRRIVLALLWCWCEGPLWLRPILEDSHFMPACDTSNMASVFTLIYAHDVRTGAKFAPRSLFAAKLVGRSGDGPRFAGGPKTKRTSAKVGVLLPHR